MTGRRRGLPLRPEGRPHLVAWLVANNITGLEFSRRLGVRHQQLFAWLRRFDNPKRRVPTLAQMEKVYDLTNGEVTPADFYPPHLTGAAATSAEAAQPEPVQ